MNKSILLALIVIIVISAAGISFFIFQNQKLVGNLTSSPSPNSQATASSSPALSTPQPSPSPGKALSAQEIQTQIKTSLNSADYQSLNQMLAENVSFILMSTECCGILSKQEAIDQMSYVKGAEPFNFDQQSQLVQDLKTNNPQLAGTYIAISQNGEQLAAFTIENGKITGIQLSVSHKLYN